MLSRLLLILALRWVCYFPRWINAPLTRCVEPTICWIESKKWRVTVWRSMPFRLASLHFMFRLMQPLKTGLMPASSTQGMVTGAASRKLIEGSCEDISLIGWSSQKVDWKCRSPGAAEAMVAVNGEDQLYYYARFQLSEMMGIEAGSRCQSSG